MQTSCTELSSYTSLLRGCFCLLKNMMGVGCGLTLLRVISQIRFVSDCIVIKTISSYHVPFLINQIRLSKITLCSIFLNIHQLYVQLRASFRIYCICFTMYLNYQLHLRWPVVSWNFNISCSSISDQSIHQTLLSTANRLYTCSVYCMYLSSPHSFTNLIQHRTTHRMHFLPHFECSHY